MSEKMRECKACKQQIAKSAKTCPHCGAKNKRVSPVLIGLIVFIVLIAAISVAGGNGEPVKVGRGSTSSNSQAIVFQTNKKEFAVGEIAELRDVQVSFVGVTESAGSTYNKPGDGNVFVLCEFEIANNSNDDVAVPL